jgi:hypothetical protein
MKPKATTAWENVQLLAKLADLKEEHYRTVLTLSAMLELLVEKGLLTHDELTTRSNQIDAQLESLISSASLHPMA